MNNPFQSEEVMGAVDRVKRDGIGVSIEMEGVVIEVKPKFDNEEVGRALLWAITTGQKFVNKSGTYSQTLVGLRVQDLMVLLAMYRKIPKDYVKKL